MSLVQLLKIMDFLINVPENIKMQMFGRCLQIYLIIYH
jgi:hypothetical protein